MSTSSEDEVEDCDGAHYHANRRTRTSASTGVLPSICIICKEKRKRTTKKGKRLYEDLQKTRQLGAGKECTCSSGSLINLTWMGICNGPIAGLNGRVLCRACLLIMDSSKYDHLFISCQANSFNWQKRGKMSRSSERLEGAMLLQERCNIIRVAIWNTASVEGTNVSYVM